MRRLGRIFISLASVAVLTTALPNAALAQRGHPAGHPPSPAPAHRPAVRHGSTVFVGGYFYDPYFGPYPWWPRWSYPYYYYPAYYDDRAVVRIIGQPDKVADRAAVYVDGFYAGVVEDFDGFFEGLPLSPGAHDIVLYMEGYRTIRRRVYMSPASTFHLPYTPQRLAAGELSEPPTLAPPIPAPPEGTFITPHTERAAPDRAPRAQATTGVVQGTLSLHVQPADAEVRIDGEIWASSDVGRYIVDVPSGTHRLTITKAGFRAYSVDVRVGASETVPVNVTLTPDQP